MLKEKDACESWSSAVPLGQGRQAKLGMICMSRLVLNLNDLLSEEKYSFFPLMLNFQCGKPVIYGLYPYPHFFFTFQCENLHGCCYKYA